MSLTNTSPKLCSVFHCVSLLSKADFFLAPLQTRLINFYDTTSWSSSVFFDRISYCLIIMTCVLAWWPALCPVPVISAAWHHRAGPCSCGQILRGWRRSGKTPRDCAPDDVPLFQCLPWKWFRSSKQVLPRKGKEKKLEGRWGGGDLLSFPKWSGDTINLTPTSVQWIVI